MGRPRNFDRTGVLEKAMPLFWRRGFADTGMQDLEKATGVNKSGLYAEFKDKQDLFLEALRHYGATRKGRELLSVQPLGWGNIESFLKFKLARKDGMNGCFNVNTMREAELLPAEALDILAESRARLKGLFLQNIAAAKSEAGGADNANDASTALAAPLKAAKPGRTAKLDKPAKPVVQPDAQPKHPEAGLSPEVLTEILSTWFSGFCIEQNVAGEGKEGKDRKDHKGKTVKSAARKVDDFLTALRGM
jgi:AcrR family transcriptional regulator